MEQKKNEQRGRQDRDKRNRDRAGHKVQTEGENDMNI